MKIWVIDNLFPRFCFYKWLCCDYLPGYSICIFFFKWTKLDILHKYKPKPREVSGLLHGGVKLDLDLPTADAMHFHHLSFLHLAFVPFSLQPAPTHPIIICVSITCFTKPFLTHSLARNLVSWMSSHISSSFFSFSLLTWYDNYTFMS